MSIKEIFRIKGVRRAGIGLIATAAVATILSGWSADARDDGSTGLKGPTKITVMAQNGTTGLTTGAWVALADKLGMLKNNGLEVDLIAEGSGGANAINGLLSGDIQIAIVGSQMPAVSQGVGIVDVAAFMDTSVWNIVAQPSFKSWDGLKGATVGVEGFKTSVIAVFKQLVAGHGYDPEADFTYIAAGGGAGRLAGLQSGKLHLTPVAAPNSFRLAEEGFTDLGLAPKGQTPPKFVAVAAYVNRGWAEKNEATLTAFLQAMHDVRVWAKKPANRDELVSRVSAITGFKEKYVRLSFELYLDNALFAPYFMPTDLKHVDGVIEGGIKMFDGLGLLPKPLTADKYVDYRYADKVKKRR